jgi:hypothetical protein
MVNVAELAPAAIVTDDGTVALELFEDNTTVTPPFPAGEESATVPVENWPPVTVEG